MHDKLSQAVKLYDQLLSAQVAHPPRRNTTAVGAAYSNAFRQAAPDTWSSPPPLSSPHWAPPQAQPAAHAQLQPSSPHVSHTLPSFVTPVSHSVGYHPASIPPQPTQVGAPSVVQTAPNQGFTRMTTSFHPSTSPQQQGADPSGNLRTFSPLRQGVIDVSPSPLPNFPTAPTLAPQSSYMPSVPQSAVQQPDRQEALLIDL